MLLPRYLPTGHIFIDPEDDCDKVVDAILETGYSEDFCLARDFEADFICRLMEAGFLVMSMELKDPAEEDNSAPSPDPFYILLPKLHLIRSVLFFPELHIKKTIRHLLSRYELRSDADFDLILDKCRNIHGEDWLTPPLVDIIKDLHRTAPEPKTTKGKKIQVRPTSFGLYRNGELIAGEFGIVTGRVYTSYSGYYEEDNTGTVQIILMVQWLEKNGFSFFDFGMPMDYKTELGAQNIDPQRFVDLFRLARNEAGT